MTMNMMIAGSIIDSLLSGLMGVSKPSIQERRPDNFDSLIKQLLLKTREANSVSNGLVLKTPEMDGLRTGIYLKAFNNGLAARGKSMDNACLKSSDIDMLTNFLLQCGYTEADAQQYIGKLLEKHPDGMIPLSEFFSQLAAPETSGKKTYSSIIMDPSVTTRFDSLLKDFGMTLVETDCTLNAARSTDGGLDLDKLIAQLKTTRDRMRGENRGTVEGIASVKVSKKLEELGIQIQPAQSAGRISMGDFITGLEQLKGRLNAKENMIDNRFLKNQSLSGADATIRGYDSRLTEKIVQTGQEYSAEVKNSAGQLPLNIKSSIDQIIEKVVAGDEKLELQLAGPSISQLKSVSSAGKKETCGSGHEAEDDFMTVAVKKNGKPTVNEESRIVEVKRQDKFDRVFDLNEGSENKKEMNPETDRDGLKTKAAEILQDGGTSSVRFETLSSIPRNRQADNSFFPEHIVDQLGRQISKSIVRGDRIINLQLNPPELGTVKLSMEIKGNTLQLGMIAESSSVKEIMLANTQELRSALLDQGIKLDRLDVQVGQDFGRSLMNLNDGSGQEHQQYQETDVNLFSDNDIQEDVLSNSRSMAGRDYLLNLKA